MTKKKTESKTEKKASKLKPKEQTVQESPEAEGMSVGKIIIAVIVVVAIAIVGGIAYFAFLANGGSAAPLPPFANTSGAVPQQFSSALSQSNGLNLVPLINSQNGNNTQLSVYYSGTLSIHIPGTIGYLTSFTSPITFSKEIYNISSKSSLNATAFPIIGAVDVQYINSTNGTYVCTSFNSTGLSNGEPQEILTSKGSGSCQRGSSLVGLNLGQISNFNLSQFNNFGITLHSQRFYQSVFNGNPCTFVGYTMTQQAQNGSFMGSGALQLCISDTNYLPLSIGANLTTTNGVKLFLILNQTRLNGTASESYINSLPQQAQG